MRNTIRYSPCVATVTFAQNLRTHLGGDLTSFSIEASDVAGALEQIFVSHPRLRSYILDDQGAVRKHVAIILDGETITDRTTLSDSLSDSGELFIMQALSGG